MDTLFAFTWQDQQDKNSTPNTPRQVRQNRRILGQKNDMMENTASGGRKGSTDRVEAAARAAGLELIVHRMPKSTRTAVEAAAACGTTPAQIVKSLVFRLANSGETALFLVSGKNRVDEGKVAGAIGDRLKRADADHVRSVTGFAIGGVAPLGSLTPLRTFIDRDLLAFDRVWAAAGAPNAVFSVAPHALAQAANAKIIAVT
jgi:prolyl-tRNA editing enzyme YbaK/EbsC (Cys-tRNA(Pro) deacylase)